MEKVWGELRKIEDKAEQIKAEAKERSNQIAAIAEQKSEHLIASAKIFGFEETEKRRESILKEAQEIHDRKMTENQQKIEEVAENAKRNMERAVSKIFDAVLGEAKVGSNNKVR